MEAVQPMAVLVDDEVRGDTVATDTPAWSNVGAETVAAESNANTRTTLETVGVEKLEHVDNLVINSTSETASSLFNVVGVNENKATPPAESGEKTTTVSHNENKLEQPKAQTGTINVTLFINILLFIFFNQQRMSALSRLNQKSRLNHKK